MRLPSTILREGNPSHTLFGTRALFSPGVLAISMDLGDFEVDVRHLLTLTSTLLHERAHWLQHIGTSFGAFSAFLSDIQAGCLGGHMEENPGRLQPSAYPWIDNPEIREDPHISAWLALEVLHLLLAGGVRRQDFHDLHSLAGGVAGLTVLRNLTFERIVRLSATADPDLGRIMAQLRPSHRVNVSEFRLPVDSQNTFGAKHLMEGAARLNEWLALLAITGHRVPGYPAIELNDLGPVLLGHSAYAAEDCRIDLSPEKWFQGVYGIARKKFYDRVKVEPNYRADIVFATLVDCALNPPLPPMAMLSTPQEIFSGHLMPWELFNHFLDFVPAFDIRSEFDVNKDSVAQIVRDFYDFLRSQNVALPSMVLDNGETMLTAMGKVSIPRDLYELDRNGLPQTNANGRLTFVAKRIHQAIQMRRERPELFILPFAAYANTPHLSHSFIMLSGDHDWPLIEPLDVPLWSHGSKLRSTCNSPGWFNYFFGSALEHDLLRWQMYCDVEELTERAANFAFSFPVTDSSRHLQDSTHAVWSRIYRILGEEVCGMVYDKFQARVKNASRDLESLALKARSQTTGAASHRCPPTSTS